LHDRGTEETYSFAFFLLVNKRLNITIEIIGINNVVNIIKRLYKFSKMESPNVVGVSILGNEVKLYRDQENIAK